MLMHQEYQWWFIEIILALGIILILFKTLKQIS